MLRHFIMSALRSAEKLNISLARYLIEGKRGAGGSFAVRLATTRLLPRQCLDTLRLIFRGYLFVLFLGMRAGRRPALVFYFGELQTAICQFLLYRLNRFAI